uniref:Uncharacterized protein n=1 Tax=Candidatus Kentrum eta TaxID=2126337 RepID=A0A450VBX8_9GAMM|nr:MAG: hypothetical protein BECKH772A_GA0070896_102031 [Candidatus Kentron sp. H]VFK02267.1 MAG: hypothetical protein BECKH772B_GA0070898_102703 [Candidatus Kentron sp. H]VFK04711.1 MAG: hypothetical protein BECKH772C_GA0070978_102011 [Candidatus Kentron sp. H]
MTVNKKWYDGMLGTEDWWAVWLGLILFLAGMFSIWGLDLVGWMAKPKTWEWTAFWADPSWGRILSVSYGKAGKAYEALSPFASLILTWLIFTALTCMGAYFQRLDVKKFFFGFTCIFIHYLDGLGRRTRGPLQGPEDRSVHHPVRDLWRQCVLHHQGQPVHEADQQGAERDGRPCGRRSDSDQGPSPGASGLSLSQKTSVRRRRIGV